MSAAIKAKSAKARATIAANMIKRQNHLYRAFDDCFEMGDGGEVVEHLINKINNDYDLAWNYRHVHYRFIPSGDDELSVRFRQAIENRLELGRYGEIA